MVIKSVAFLEYEIYAIHNNTIVNSYTTNVCLQTTKQSLMKLSGGRILVSERGLVGKLRQ